MANSNTALSKKLRVETATNWNKKVTHIQVKLKPGVDDEYIKLYGQIDKDKYIKE